MAVEYSKTVKNESRGVLERPDGVIELEDDIVKDEKKSSPLFIVEWKRIVLV